MSASTRLLCTLLLMPLALLVRAADVPGASWATLFGGSASGYFNVGVAADPAGGFYMFSASDRPLIKLDATGAIAWEAPFKTGVNQTRLISQMDVLDGGALILAGEGDVNAPVFGRNLQHEGRFLARLRGSDGSPLLLSALQNCWITALKARPGGIYLVAGYGSGTARIGAMEFSLGSGSVFVAQISTSLDWIVTGSPITPITALGTIGSGANLQFIAAGSSTAGWSFGGNALDRPGAFLVNITGGGQATGALIIGDGTFQSLATGPNGEIYVAWKNAAGENFVRQTDVSGGVAWEQPAPAAVVSMTAGDDLYVATAGWSVSAFDAGGNLKWRRDQLGREVSFASGAAVLADGRLLIGGSVQPSGIFIDDFFVRDFDSIGAISYDAFLMTLEAGAQARPSFRVQPRDQKLAVRGETITLSADVYSPDGCAFQWFKDNDELFGETDATLVLPDIQAADLGSYYVEASNGAGTTRSKTVEVTVNQIKLSVVPGTDAAGAFESPRNPVVLPDGSIVVADTAKHLLRRVGANGVTTFAGSGAIGSTGGAPLEAKFTSPTALAIEMHSEGPKVYLADRDAGVVWQIRFSPETGEAVSVDQLTSQIAEPIGVAAIEGIPWKLIAVPRIPVILKYDGGTIGPALNVILGAIGAMAVDERGNVYIGGPSAINAVPVNGGLKPLAGLDHPGFLDGDATVALFDDPSAITLDESGNLYITERGNHSVRKISPTGFTTTLAGSGVFNSPEGLCFRNGSLIVADTGNHCLRELRFEPVTESQTSDAHIALRIDEFLHLSVEGNSGEQYEIESSAQIGAAANWNVEGTVSTGPLVGELVLQRPAVAQFFRARRLP